MREIVAIAVALSVATWFVEGHAERFEGIGSELLVNPHFDAGLDGWVAKERGGGKVIAQSDGVSLDVSGCGGAGGVGGGCEATIDQVIPYDGRDPVELSGELEGGHPRDGIAYLLLRDEDATGHGLAPDWEIAKDRGLFTGGGWSPFRAVVRPHAGTASLGARVVRVGADGNLTARDISVRPVREKSLFIGLTLALQAAWVGFFGWVAVATGRAAPRPRVHAVAVVLAVVMIAALVAPMPDIAITPAELAIHHAPVAASAPPPALPLWIEIGRALRAAFPSDEDDHFGMFVALGAIATIAWPGRRPLVAAALVGFAALSEILQFFTAHRTPGFDDLWTDSLGLAMGIACALALEAVWSAWNARYTKGGP